ncbi:hypothetical protein [Planctobacterium marinum]|uniref:hypothetical protein n=1 Tax=Planctobacterium marinum TaxID=1631968 RepID=UPI001E3E8770|nr:hypothetical protein [Planctobacterium marinum]MCC2604016.1 hypothetical protein [Planctobacterium marinum]
MIKNIIIAALLIGFGYTLSVFWPMDPSWQEEVKAPFKADGLIGGSIVGEWVGVVDEPVSTEATAAEEDKTQYATQRDLLVSPMDVDVTYTVLLGEYPNEDDGNRHLALIGITDVAPTYIPYKTPLGNKALLLLLGNYKDEHTAQIQEKQWEAVYDVNLQVVKMPVLPDPEAEAKQKQAEETAEALSKILNPDA